MSFCRVEVNFEASSWGGRSITLGNLPPKATQISLNSGFPPFLQLLMELLTQQPIDFPLL